MYYPTNSSLIQVEKVINYSQNLFEAIDDNKSIPFYKDWKFYIIPGYGWVKVYEYFAKKKADRERKQELYIKAIERQNEIIHRLRKKQEMSEEYIRQLEETNEQLMEVIRKLKQDLEL